MGKESIPQDICDFCYRAEDNFRKVILYKTFQEKLTAIRFFIERQKEAENLRIKRSKKFSVIEGAVQRIAAFHTILNMLEDKYDKHLLPKMEVSVGEEEH